MLTNEELVELIQANIDVQNNMELLYFQNKGMIAKISRYFSFAIDYEDLMQEAYFGLQKATEKFDSSMGIKFMSFATSYIKWHLQKYVSNSGKIKRIPQYINDRISNYHKFVNEYKDQHFQKPSDDKIMAHLEITKKQYDELLIFIFNSKIYSTADIINGTDMTFEDTLVDESVDIEEQIIDEVFDETLKKELWEAVSGLQSRQSEVITERYKNNKTLDCISEKMNISRQRIREISDTGLKNLSKMKKLRELADAYGYNSSMLYATSLTSFKNNNNISSVERIALQRLELNKKQYNKTQCEEVQRKQEVKLNKERQERYTRQKEQMQHTQEKVNSLVNSIVWEV